MRRLLWRVSLLLAVLVLVVVLSLTRREPGKERAVASSTPIDWHGQTRVELPLSLTAHGNPTIPVRVLGGDTMALIDSGGGMAAMDAVLAAALGASFRGTMRVNSREYKTVEHVPVQVGTGFMNLRRMVVADLSGQVRLLLGMELFLYAIVDMDFDAGRMTLIHPDAFTPPAGEPVAVQFIAGVPTIQLKVKGRERPICVSFDTGFDGGIALTPEMVREIGLPSYPDRLRTNLGFGGVRHVGPALVPLEEVWIGDRSYREVPVAEIRPEDGSPCASLLGMTVLSRHHLVFDLRNRRIWLLPRTGIQQR